MTQAQGIKLARDFAQAEFVDQGMIADLNVHWDIGGDGMPKPHAHVMLTMRSMDENGFGQKVRDWNHTEMVERWRERWAEHVNERLAELDIDARIDHHSLEVQGIELETPNRLALENKLRSDGFEMDDVSIEYLLEYLPHERDFGSDTLGLQEADAVRRVLGSLTLSTARTRPVAAFENAMTATLNGRVTGKASIGAFVQG